LYRLKTLYDTFLRRSTIGLSTFSLRNFNELPPAGIDYINELLKDEFQVMHVPAMAGSPIIIKGSDWTIPRCIFSDGN
jgi:hypothetical protein